METITATRDELVKAIGLWRATAKREGWVDWDSDEPGMDEASADQLIGFIKEAQGQRGAVE